MAKTRSGGQDLIDSLLGDEGWGEARDLSDLQVGTTSVEPRPAFDPAEFMAETDDLVGDGEDRFGFEKSAVVYPEGGEGSGRLAVRRNQFGDANVPSDKQVAFLGRLLKEKLDWKGTPQEYVAALGQGWTKKFVSRAIDLLLKEADLDNGAATPLVERKEVRKNKYAGKCTKCGGWVEAEAGVLVKTADGRWGADHTECPPPVAVVETELCPEGMHRLPDGRIFKVQIAHHGSGLPYAKQLVVRELEDGRKDAEFVYAQGAIRLLSSATLMTLEEARAYGALYGVCCNCAAVLTDEDSIRLGIGPVCGVRVMEWATGVQMTKAQMVLLGKLEDGPQTPTGLAKRTAQALADAGLARFDGTTLTKVA